MTTPQDNGRRMVELIRSLRPKAGETDLRYPPGEILKVVKDADGRLLGLANVKVAGDVEIAVKHGTFAPKEGLRYPVFRTRDELQWIKANAPRWCKIWTLDEHFNEDGAQFLDDMLTPAFGDQIELPTFNPFGTGADGPAIHNLNAGDIDLNNASLVGRAYPDCAFHYCNDTDIGWTDSVKHPGYVAVRLPPGTAQVGDEVLLYLAQTGKNDSEEIAFVGHWETHYLTLFDDDNPGLGYFRGKAYKGGFGRNSEFDHCPPPGRDLVPPVCIPITYDLHGAHSVSGTYGDASWLIQRIPQYTNISQSGTLTVNSITCGAHRAGGSGVLFLRANGTTSARFTAVAKGYAGGLRGEICEMMDNCEWWQHSHPGQGKRLPSGLQDPYDGGFGVWGGGGSGGNGRCRVPDTTTMCIYCDPTLPDLDCPHWVGQGHHADIPTAGAGGGHATAGLVPPDSTQHRRHGVLGPYDYAGRPPGNSGAVIGQSDMASKGWQGASCFGGGGGSAGDYWFFDRNPDGSEGPGSSYAGTGGAGGGFIGLFARFVHNNAGGDASIPAVDVNGGGAGHLCGAGAGGSAIIYAEEVGPSIGLNPYFAAEARDVTGANVGWSGLANVLGGTWINNANDIIYGAGNGGLGRIHVHWTVANNGYVANGSVYTSSGAPHFAGCWSSAIYESHELREFLEELPEDERPLLDANLQLWPDLLRALWALDSDGVRPTFYIEMGDSADLSDGVIYPKVPPLYWQDGGAHDIDNNVELDLGPYAVKPAAYMRVWACLDGGAQPMDTPAVLEIELCGTAQ